MHLKSLFLFFFLSLPAEVVFSQALMERPVSVTSTRQPLKNILRDIGKQGHFYFSYNSSILPEDSLVTISVNQMHLKDVLQQLLGNGYLFSAHNNYLIIRLAHQPLLTVTGIISDAATGQPLADATVYSKEQLRSVFTNKDGGYTLSLRPGRPVNNISVGRVGYLDTTVLLVPGESRPVLLSLLPSGEQADPVTVTAVLPKSWTGRLLLSSRQRLRSLNLRHFFTGRKFQLSLVPGLSTMGNMSGQSVNNLSVNVIGGYTAGVKGAEFGGLFNLNRSSAGYLQVAGILNATGGSFRGLQVATAHNTAGDTLRGLQLSFLHNYARIQHGVQVGLINASDSSTGISLGLLNFVKNGSRRLALYSSDLVNTVVAYKTGNRHFYNILLAGNNTGGRYISTIGLGLGYNYAPAPWYSLSTEINYQAIRLESWSNRLMQAKLLLNLHGWYGIGLFGGPVYNRYVNSDFPEEGSKNPVTLKEFVAANLAFRKAVKTWSGWEAGVFVETVRQSSKKVKRRERWTFEPVLSFTRADHSAQWKPAGDIRLQKDFAVNISLLVSGGYARLADGAGIPLLAGVKFFAAGPFYIAGHTGYVGGLEKNPGSWLTGLAAGIQLSSGADISAGYEHPTQLHIEQIKLSAGYHFAIKK